MPRTSAPIAELKKKKFAREFVKNGGHGTLAYSRVYPEATKDSARSSSPRMLKDEIVKKEILTYQQVIAKKTGPNFIAKKLKNLCNAERKIYFEGREIGTDTDNPTQLGAVRTVLQSQGVLAEKSGAPAAVANVNVQINLA